LKRKIEGKVKKSMNLYHVPWQIIANELHGS